MNKTPALDMTLRLLRLPTVLSEYGNLAKTAAADNWSYEQYLQNLMELESEERRKRRVERLLRRSQLPEGKNLATLEKEMLSSGTRALLPNLINGDFVQRADNVLVFGLPGRGKTHLVAAIARELVVRHGISVLFISTFALVQKLLAAKAELRLEQFLNKLDKIEVIVLDDIGYVQQSREEMEVLFTFLAERYERKSLMITSNLVFSQWDRIFKDPMTTAAAIDRLVHHSVIIEMTGQSYRLNQADRKTDE